ncbi:hypothetical protein PQC36_gp061 [Proteus phage Vb_PmiP-P59]|uniref:Uncharacterized protein n=1 Tax=Proteus phage Vb_PmiP-P59 TaxID=2754975 RepID=A0A7G5CG29_9CAUD|nr:hypothetical protein PQC36_gp061 [Proteus phage Vb_PmiP-P59]QMV48231.1 hypothetical protein [Proteus phage Vb_PmiP-P59]
MFKDDLTKFKNIPHSNCFYNIDGFIFSKVKPSPFSNVKCEMNAVCMENGYLYNFDEDEEVYIIKDSTIKNP